MDFTIVTPSYNSGSYIRQTILSVLTQKDVRIQYVVQDSCSADDTYQIIEDITKSDVMRAFIDRGSTFALKSEKDSGQSNAINRGFRDAEGRFLAWVNADDFYYPDALSLAKRELEKEAGQGMIYGDINYVSQAGAVLKRRSGIPFSYRTLLEAWCFIPQPSAFWTKTLWANVGQLNEELHLCMDYDFWLRCGLKVTPRYIPHVFAGYRIMSSSKTGASPLIAMPEALMVGRRYGAPYVSRMRLASWFMRIGLFSVVRVAARKLLKTA